MAYLHLAHTLADAFNALADEVQTLTDRKTVLEHKLRFAHEQVRNFFSFLVAGPLSLPLPLTLAAQASSGIPLRRYRSLPATNVSMMNILALDQEQQTE
jgi:hypothetical protein